jgi:hypothetical protein
MQIHPMDLMRAINYLIDKVRLGITPVADDGGRHGD